VPAYTPPTAFGFTTNKARIGRALGESSRGESHWASDADYIPYRGPISPPSEITSAFSQQQQQQRQVDDRSAERRLYLPPHQSSLTSPNIIGGPAEKEAPASIPRFKDVHYSASSALGLEQPTERAISPANGRYIGTGLPSAYTHGGNATSQGSSSAGC